MPEEAVPPAIASPAQAPEGPGASERRRLLLPSPLVAAAMPSAYFVAAVLAVHLTQAFGNVASIWLSTGILLAALVRHKPRAWPALALLAAAADLAAGLAVGTPAALAAGFTAFDVGEALLAAAVLRRLGEPAAWFTCFPRLALFALVALLAPIASATPAAVLVTLLGNDGVPFAQAWSTWYTSEALGLLLVVPFLLSWTDPALRRDLPVRKVLEAHRRRRS